MPKGKKKRKDCKKEEGRKGPKTAAHKETALFHINSLLTCDAKLTFVYDPFRAATGLNTSDLPQTPSEVKPP